MKFIYAILLTLILSVSVNAAKIDKTGFFFVQIADTQLGFSTNTNDLTPDIEHFQKAVDAYYIIIEMYTSMAFNE